ncbi:hypothetical protein JRX38_02480 [Gluconobacter cerinus]|uniref:hypothetical protein n=1 Tax=Gluconobacter cerinus TaxID=38307 RepID=UPI00193FA48A|nr:hypothetical protein [Gluconobacter cerinus]MBM3096897.1 hypothetical protein [Gluconobacter cerinus]
MEEMMKKFREIWPTIKKYPKVSFIIIPPTVGLAWLVFKEINPPNPQTSTTISCSSGSNCANNQSGGISAGIINYGPKKRVLSDQQKIQLLIMITPNSTVYIHSKLGDAESEQLARQTESFLKSHGYTIGGLYESAYREDPGNGTIEKSNLGFTIYYGSNPDK